MKLNQPQPEVAVVECSVRAQPVTVHDDPLSTGPVEGGEPDTEEYGPLARHNRTRADVGIAEVPGTATTVGATSLDRRRWFARGADNAPEPSAQLPTRGG